MNFKYVLPIFLLISIVLVAGCIGQEEFKKNQPANFTIASPANWENVASNVTLKFSSENIKLIQPTGKNVVGEGHYHLFIDNSSYVIVSENTYAFTNLSTGVHIIRIELHNNDHSPTGIERSIMFTVLGDTDSKVSNTRDFEILTPNNWDNVGVDVTIKLLPKNFDVVQPSDNNDDKQGHFHLFLDNGSYIMVAAKNYTFYNLTSGQHSVRITSNYNDHTESGFERTYLFNIPDFTTVLNTDGYSKSATVKFIITNFEIVPPKNTLESNKGHFHLFLDNGTYVLVTSNSYTFNNLTSGTHTLRITMNNNDHTYAGIEKTIVFTI
ncbi:MAG: hypothetical protein HY831_00050 [Candidatus Aenigmarchaeota archaeon]|nr:hypothetical protein [Candidatus Aenigmarchaeota archaeon]